MTSELKPGSKSKSEWEFSLEYLPSIASAMLIVRRMLIRRTKNWRRMWEGILLVSAAELASCFSSRRKSLCIKPLDSMMRGVKLNPLAVQ